MTEGKKLLLAAGITGSVYLGMKFLLPYVIPFFIAWLLVRLLNPVTECIRRKLPWRKEVIVSGILFLMLAVFSVVFYWFYCRLREEIRRIALNFDGYYSVFSSWIDRCCCMVEENFGIQVGDVRSFVYDTLNQADEQIRLYLVPNVLNYSVRYLRKALEAGAFVLILFVAVILLMKDYDEMHEKLQRYTLYRHVHRVIGRIWAQGGQYLKAQAMIIGVVSLLCVGGLWILQNAYFLVLGIVTGLLDALPFIGTGTILFPMAVVLAMQNQYRLAAGYVLLFLATYFVREFLEPRLIGSRLGIYPVVMMIVVYAGLYLYGPAGVLLGPVSLLLVMEIWKEIFMQEENEQNASKS